MSATDFLADLFAALRELSEVVPEMRVGQLMAVVGELCADLHGRGLWDASDAELLEAAWQFRRDFQAATGRPSGQDAERVVAADRGRHDGSSESPAQQAAPAAEL